MAPRKRPSGLGSNSQRFAVLTRPDGQQVKIPQTRDAATCIYMANEDGTWPKQFLVKLLTDAAWAIEGHVFLIENLAPGHMGEVTTVKVIQTHENVQYTPGGLGQVLRSVLVTPVLDYAVLEGLTLDELEAATYREDSE